MRSSCTNCKEHGVDRQLALDHIDARGKSVSILLLLVEWAYFARALCYLEFFKYVWRQRLQKRGVYGRAESFIKLICK